MTSRISLSLFSFLLLLFSANACTCPPVSINSAYFNAGTKRFVKAKLALSYPIGDKQAYTLRIEREYKACGKVPKYVGVLTSLTASLCGVTLKGQTSYIIALKSLNNANISLCDYIKEFSTLTQYELNFLNQRQICCPAGIPDA